MMMFNHNYYSPVHDLLSMIQGVAWGFYPDFVTSNGFSNQLPIFYYHEVNEIEFNQQLMYLRRNKYTTLTTDDCYQVTTSSQALDPRWIILTFDDGLDDLYHVAYPLLKKYGLKGVAFIIPKWIGHKGMVTWKQVVEMHESGVIDFQSHSLQHASIFTSNEIIGLFDGMAHGKPWDVPVVRKNEADQVLGISEIGAPIYRFTSRMSDSPRYYPDVEFDERLKEAIKSRCGDDFHKSKATRRVVSSVINSVAHSRIGRDNFESKEEQIDAIKNELILSKKIIEQNLPGKCVSHFAFPWSQTGELALELMPRCGYKSAYTGLLIKNSPGGNKPRTSQGFWRFNRVNGDFLYCLPGKDRQPFVRILLQKMIRRVRRGSIN
jgi:peptidoglycan/xylan/chitin deacetylase (PgdA/CDA1 family)